MDFQKLLMENKPVFYGIIAGITAIVIVLIIVVAVSVARPANKSGQVNAPAPKVIQEDISLLTTDKIGLAIEVQALLARNGIKARFYQQKIKLRKIKEILLF